MQRRGTFNDETVGDSYFNALIQLHDEDPIGSVLAVNYLLSLEGKNGVTGYKEIVDSYYKYLYQLEAEADRAAIDERKRRDKEERERLQAEAEAERAAIDERKRRDREERERLQAEAEAEREQLQQQQEVFVEANEIINEGNNMTEDEAYLNFQAKTPTVDLDTQLVTSGSEYTIVDETDETISYVDETGALHVEQKAKSGLGWLIAAAAAFFLLG